MQPHVVNLLVPEAPCAQKFVGFGGVLLSQGDERERLLVALRPIGNRARRYLDLEPCPHLLGGLHETIALVVQVYGAKYRGGVVMRARNGAKREMRGAILAAVYRGRTRPGLSAPVVYDVS